MSIATTSSTSSQGDSRSLPLYYVSASEDSSLLLLDLSDTSSLANNGISGHLSPASVSTLYTEEGRSSPVALGSSFSNDKELILLPESPSTSPSSPCLGSPPFLLSSPVQSSTPQRSPSRALLTSASVCSDDLSICLTSPGSSQQRDLERITQLLSCTCCAQRCLANLSVVQIESCRKWFHSRNRTEQNQFLLDTYHISGTNSCTSGTVYNILEGRAVCKRHSPPLWGFQSEDILCASKKIQRRCHALPA